MDCENGHIEYKPDWESLTSVALRGIFSYLEVRHLKNCRFVCKAWNKESCIALRKLTVVHIASREENGSRNDIVKFRELYPLQNSDEIPFGSFEVYARGKNKGEFFQGIENLLENTKDYGKLWKLRIGPIIPKQYDTFLYPFLQNHHHTESVINLRLDEGYHCKLLVERPELQFPELKSLSFEINGDTSDTTKYLIMDVIKGAPKLNQVTVLTVRGTPNSRTRVDNEILLELMSLDNFKNIQSLTVDVSSTTVMENVIQGLKSLRGLTTLKFLSQSFELPVNGVHDLMQTLARFSQNMRHLDFGQCEVNQDIVNEKFPVSPLLESFGIRNFQPGSKYFSRMPALKLFIFYEGCVENDIPFQSDTCLLSVETVDTGPKNKNVSPSEFLSLQRQFPNCTQLCMHISAAETYFLTPELNQPGWRKLNAILLCGGVSTFTGRKILDLLVNWQDNQSQAMTEADEDSTSGLKRLSLDWNFTDEAMVSPIGRLNYLEVLHIRWSKNTIKQKLNLLVETLSKLENLKEIAVAVKNCNPTCLAELETLANANKLIRARFVIANKVDIRKKFQRFQL